MVNQLFLINHIQQNQKARHHWKMSSHTATQENEAEPIKIQNQVDPELVRIQNEADPEPVKIQNGANLEPVKIQNEADPEPMRSRAVRQ